MNDELIEAEALEIIMEASDALLTPHPNECLLCYVFRELAQFGCNGQHRFSMYYRDARAPRATALYRRLARKGACCCDCELFLNTYCLAPHVAPNGEAALEYRYHLPVEGLEVRPIPPCAGVRHGSTQPCSNWLEARPTWLGRH